ncbi:MAG: hypothetical protein Q7S80_00805 [bacterium]|nr:hypothetical protein [bacterium]
MTEQSWSLALELFKLGALETVTEMFRIRTVAGQSHFRFDARAIRDSNRTAQVTYTVGLAGEVMSAALWQCQPSLAYDCIAAVSTDFDPLAAAMVSVVHARHSSDCGKRLLRIRPAGGDGGSLIAYLTESLSPGERLVLVDGLVRVAETLELVGAIRHAGCDVAGIIVLTTDMDHILALEMKGVSTIRVFYPPDLIDIYAEFVETFGPPARQMP